MHNADGYDLYVVDGDWGVRLNLDEVDGWYARVALVVRRKAVGYTFREVVGAELFGIDVYVSKDAVGAQVVKSSDVIVVFVSDEDCVKRFKFDVQHLLAKVGAAVYEQARSVCLDEGRGAQSLVFVVGGGADIAGAAYLWHSARCSASKYGYLHGLAFDFSGKVTSFLSFH